MVLRIGKGRIPPFPTTREPMRRKLSSFAINLTGNPTLANMSRQMSGERIEVAVSPTAANQPANSTAPSSASSTEGTAGMHDRAEV